MLQRDTLAEVPPPTPWNSTKPSTFHDIASKSGGDKREVSTLHGDDGVAAGGLADEFTKSNLEDAVEKEQGAPTAKSTVDAKLRQLSPKDV
jgi:hypothetical protein